MKYRLLLSDIDGTLLPELLPKIPRPNVEAIQTIQRYGVKFAISTGRARSGISEDMLNGLQPDYWICGAGAQVLAQNGTVIASSRMGREQVEALTEFCAREGYPLIFAFSDGAYMYAGYDEFFRIAREAGIAPWLKNGEDRTRHLAELPFSAASQLPPEAADRFQAQHGALGLRFVYYGSEGCDILRPGQDKALGLAILAEHAGFRIAECISVGDGDNDVGILQAAGLSFCVEGGSPGALAAADRTCPSAAEFGVAAVCRMMWPEAFA